MAPPHQCSYRVHLRREAKSEVTICRFHNVQACSGKKEEDTTTVVLLEELTWPIEWICLLPHVCTASRASKFLESAMMVDPNNVSLC